MVDPSSPFATDVDAAFDALRPVAPALYRTARRMTRRADDAAAVVRDAVSSSQTWLLARPPAAELSGRLHAALWLALERYWQREGRGERESGPEAPDDLLASALDGDEVDFERLLMSRLDASPELDIALRHLGERERFLVLLVDVENLTYEEAAVALHTDVEVVQGLLLTARARVFHALADFARRTSGAHPRA
ncbi:MAG: hypothetical protein IT178_00335 [Acidobacteria bacterium]|nr:hypothetical protein [Acidobacteriota bacterium]